MDLVKCCGRFILWTILDLEKSMIRNTVNVIKFKFGKTLLEESLIIKYPLKVYSPYLIKRYVELSFELF